LEVRILKGLRGLFKEVLILKELEAEEEETRRRKEKCGVVVPKGNWSERWQANNI